MTFDSLIQLVVSSIGQVFAVFLISFIVYIIYRLLMRDRIKCVSFFEYVGLVKTQNQFDKTFASILLISILFSIISTYFQFEFSETFRSFLVSDTSPYGKILNYDFNLYSILAGAVYCFIQSGASEEILFRGLIGRRLFKKFGYKIGNLIQAVLFWLMHLIIFGLVTGDWISWIQTFAFVVGIGMGLLTGFVNFRNHGKSIAPSWVLHSFSNFITFMTLAYLIKS
jgi:membrane protease YdiL (CAAX protease family)